eukprot:TRINITY_DN22830_c0_g1_i1.p2 TRINITY_DN22830_c0_g1~~TRINITY_DN22830_c0_g1_i1.p2  ORF type:complete len:163 (+),score=43.64 TRINITY_DN22830_c0_g1_i1:117-605(+)
MLAAILKAHPSIDTGAIFDLPNVINAKGGTKEFLAKEGLQGRVDAVPGNFFQDSPPVAGKHGAIAMKWILHDWSDQESVDILRGVRKSLQGGRLLIVEFVHPEEGHPFVSFADTHMMVLVGGKERTLDDWRALTQKANLAIAQVHPLKTPERAMVVLECVEN